MSDKHRYIEPNIGFRQKYQSSDILRMLVSSTCKPTITGVEMVYLPRFSTHKLVGSEIGITSVSNGFLA